MSIKPRGYYKEWKNLQQELISVQKLNKGLIPPRPVLKKQGFGHLVKPMKLYHEGVKKIRKRLGIDTIKECKNCATVKNISEFALSGPSLSFNSIGHPRYKAVCKICYSLLLKLTLEKDWDCLIKRRVTEIRKRAKKRSLPFDLTFEWLKGKLVKSNYCCEMTGLSFDRKRNLTGGANAMSIDRIIPSLGYTMNNCRIIILSLNWALNKFKDANFIPVAIGFLENKGYIIKKAC